MNPFKITKKWTYEQITGIVFGTLPIFIFGVLSIIYTIKNWGAFCDRATIQLHIWLLVLSVVSVIFVMVQMFSYVLLTDLFKETYIIRFVPIHVCITVVYLIFLMVWITISPLMIDIVCDRCANDNCNKNDCVGNNCNVDVNLFWAMSFYVFLFEFVSAISVFLLPRYCKPMQSIQPENELDI